MNFEEKLEQILSDFYLEGAPVEEVTKKIIQLFNDEVGQDEHNGWCNVKMNMVKYGGEAICDCNFTDVNRFRDHLREKLGGKEGEE